MAQEQGAFDFGDVVAAITTKLIRRHPHVFGDRDAQDPQSVKGLWDEIKAQERAAKAAYVQAAEQYRSTVLTAFQNVADTLTALEQDAEALKAAATAVDAAKTTLDLAQRQLQDGYAGYLALLSAEQAYQQGRINLVQAQANRYADTAALFQALGGGWWHRADLQDKHER